MIPFEPLFRNRHLATVCTAGVRAFLDVERFPPDDRLVETEPGVRIRVVSQAPEGQLRGHFVLVHGLEGSSEGSYMRSLAQAALVNGFAPHRMNMRNCGGTEAHCRTLYHAGLTVDIERYLAGIRQASDAPIYLIGFSLGGSQVSKLAGTLGEEARQLLAGVCAVSTPVDLAVCSRSIQSRDNWLYQWQFVYRMKRTIRRKHALMPDLFSLKALESIRTIWGIDDHFVAPLGGFRDAEHYYASQSALNFLGNVRLPMLMMHAADDPFIPISLYRHPAIEKNPNIQFVSAKHGGHMGFIARETPRFWANEVVLRWVEALEQRQSTHAMAGVSAW